MNKTLFLYALLLIIGLPVVAQNACANMGFEDGTFSGWCRKTGIVSNTSYTQINGYDVNYNSSVVCNNDDIFDDIYAVSNDSDTIPRLTECTDYRFKIVDRTSSDSNNIDLNGIKYGDYAVRLGNECVQSRVDRIEQTFTVGANNNVFTYNYAVAFQDTGTCSHITFENLSENECNASIPNPEHVITKHSKPYFTVYLEQNGKKIECSEFLIFGDNRVFDFDSSSNVFVKQWQENSLDLLRFVNEGDQVTVVAEVGDCGFRGHYGYAYFEATCGNTLEDVTVNASQVNACVGDVIEFNSSGGFGDYFWTFYDDDTGDVLANSYEANTTFTYNEAGHYRVTYGLPDTRTTGECFLNESTLFIDIEDCGNSNEACEACDSFKPIPGNTYWLGAWVKEKHEEQVLSYTDSAIDLVFSDANNQPIDTISLVPSGEIIDGWQRIIGEFTIPSETVYFNLNLVNKYTSPVYFDDVRVHTVNGNMKSFVYDPENYRLMAELDENNYSTFYEYDKEGGLVRVKKETAEGIMTIQESRSSSVKTEN